MNIAPGRGHVILLAALLALALCVSPAFSAKVAVMPTANLSGDSNSILQELDRKLTERIIARGDTVIPEAEIADFLGRHRIRNAGQFETFQILQAGQELNAEFILIASVCQFNPATPILGLTASLYRTTDSRVVWSGTMGMSGADDQRLLGLNQVDSIAKLQTVVLDRLLFDLPALGQELSLAGMKLAGLAAPNQGYYEIESAVILPQHVQPGGTVSCTIRLRSVGSPDFRPKIYIKSGNQVHHAMETNDPLNYQVTWDAPPVTADKVVVAMNTPTPLLYRNLLAGEASEAVFPVSIELAEPDGRQQSSFIGTYAVDNSAPVFSLVPQGTMIGGQMHFADRLPIGLRFEKREPLMLWQLVVTDSEGLTVLEETGRNILPPRFEWNGRRVTGKQVKAGDYDITLTLWDRAGNMGKNTVRVSYSPDPPPVSVELAAASPAPAVTLAQKEGVAAEYWQLEIWSDKDELVQKREGDRLPFLLSLPEPATNGPVNRYTLTVRNVLGRSATLNLTKNIDLALKTAIEKNEEAAPRATWVENF